MRKKWNMKKVIFYILGLLVIPINAQENFEVYYEESEKGYTIYADNGEFSPVSVEIDFTIENLTSSIGDIKIIKVPAETEKYYIADLVIVDRRKSVRLGFGVRYNHGNHLQESYDTDFVYQLPFKKGTTHMVTQGYNGKTSHQNEYALDFRMPVGTAIYAARGGRIVLVEENFDKACTSSNCAKFNNYILVYHKDGTFAEYTHIKKNGSIVKAGDTIEIGELIGYSGNVGWSTGPHLHFIVFLQRFKTRETLPTKFRVGKGEEIIELQEKTNYGRLYESRSHK